MSSKEGVPRRAGHFRADSLAPRASLPAAGWPRRLGIAASLPRLRFYRPVAVAGREAWEEGPAEEAHGSTAGGRPSGRHTSFTTTGAIFIGDFITKFAGGRRQPALRCGNGRCRARGKAEQAERAGRAGQAAPRG